MIEKITNGGELQAMILRSNYTFDGINSSRRTNFRSNSPI